MSDDEPKGVSFKPRTPAQLAGDIVFIQNAAKTLVNMNDGERPEGMTDQMARDVEAIAQLDVLPMKAAAMGAMTGLVHGEQLYVMWAKARNALHMLGSLALLKLADKANNSKAPGDTRVLMKLVEWAGLPTPQEAPTNDSDRLDALTQADLKKMTDEDLKEELKAALKKGSS